MIRHYNETDLPTLLQLWLQTNISAHDFIPAEYWHSQLDLVKELLPQAEIYVAEHDCTGQIEGFLGLMDDYIAGIFVSSSAQSKGIGKQLLDAAKERKSSLQLSVYQKNVRAIRFYKREQFRIQSENTDDATGETEFLMTWSRSQG